MKTRILILLLSALTLNMAHAKSIYISPTGLDSNNGLTPQTPFFSFNKARNSLKPGDFLVLRGGVYNSTGNAFGTSSAGTPGNPITITAYPGEIPVFTGKPQYGSFFSFNHSWWVLENVEIRNSLASVPVTITNCKNIVIRKNKFIGQSPSAGSNIRILTGSYHTIEDNHFDTVGTNSNSGQGSHIYVMGSDYNLIQNNYFARAGHAAIDLIDDKQGRFSEFNIVRKNLIEQHWGGGIYVLLGASYNVVEDNVIYYAGEMTTYPKGGLSVSAERNIVRRNIVAETKSVSTGGMAVYAFLFSSIHQHSRYNKIYNNIIYKSYRGALYYNQKDISINTQNYFVNNILYYNKVLGPQEPWLPAGNNIINFETYHAFPNNKWASFPNDNYFFNNVLLHADATGDKPGEPKIIHEDVNQRSYSLAQVQNLVSNHFVGNVEYSPQFIDADNRDFRLQPTSQLIDAGKTLARVVADGSGVDVPLDDAGYFTNGWGIVQGDRVRIGGNPPVVITAISSNTITVNSPVSFVSGDAVNLDYLGNGPDIGPFEANPVTPPDTTLPSLAILAPQAGEVSGLVTISGTASDDSGLFTIKVYVDDVEVLTETAGVYSVVWDATGLTGNHLIEVQVTDAAGNSISEVRAVTVPPPPDTTLPTVSIEGLIDGQIVTGVVTISGTASDDVGVETVELSINSVPVITFTSAPYTYAWDTALEASGTHSLSLKALDKAGNMGLASVLVTIEEIIPPPPVPTDKREIDFKDDGTATWKKVP